MIYRYHRSHIIFFFKKGWCFWYFSWIFAEVHIPLPGLFVCFSDNSASLSKPTKFRNATSSKCLIRTLQMINCITMRIAWMLEKPIGWMLEATIACDAWNNLFGYAIIGKNVGLEMHCLRRCKSSAVLLHTLPKQNGMLLVVVLWHSHIEFDSTIPFSVSSRTELL